MVTSSQTSFIPKQPTSLGKSKRHPSRTSLFVAISGFILFFSLLAASGVYGYERMLLANVTDMTNRLNRLRSSFEPSLIAELKRLDTRLDTLDGLLKNHIAFSNFFSLLSNETLQSIRFTRFEYSYESVDGPVVRLAGRASGYSSVALQSDVFGKSKYFHNPIFSDMTLDNEGNVIFNVSLIIDPVLLEYGTNNTAHSNMTTGL